MRRDVHPQIAVDYVRAGGMQTRAAVDPHRRKEGESEAELHEEAFARGGHLRHCFGKLTP